MKTALLPATRVAPELRKRVEGLLHEGETVSAFIEAAVSLHAEARAAQRAFVARGLAAEASGEWVEPAEVFAVVRTASKTRTASNTRNARTSAIARRKR